MTSYCRSLCLSLSFLTACGVAADRALPGGSDSMAGDETTDSVSSGEDDSSTSSESSDPGAGTSTTDGTSATGGTSTTGSSSTTGDPSGTHPACDSPLPSPLPALPPINMTGDRPAFTDWEELDCDAIAGNWDFCNGPGDPPCGGACLSDGPDQRGICTSFDVDLWCDGEGEVMGYGDGSCWMCAPIDAKAIACCADLPGFDCRIWPYEFNGRVGDPCAQHENCEPGLVCGSGGGGYGICQCPAPDDPIEFSEQCYQL